MGEFERRAIATIEAAWQQRDDALMEGLRLTKLLEDAERGRDEWKEKAVKGIHTITGCEVGIRYEVAMPLKLIAEMAELKAEITTLKAKVLKLGQAKSVHISGSGIAMKFAPVPPLQDERLVDPIDVLRAIEASLVEASNLLQDVRLDGHDRYGLLDDAIDKALREVQAWKEEAEG
jgi:hypothetical protein